MLKHLLLLLFSFLLVQTTSAADLDLTKYKGQVVYLDFWASWCEPCKESFPWLNEIQKKYPKLKIIGVNLDKEKKLADAFLKERPAQFEIIYNPNADLAEKFGVQGMPYSVLLNKDGKIHSSHIGFSKEIAKKHVKEIESLLGVTK